MLATLNQSATDLGILKRQHALGVPRDAGRQSNPRQAVNSQAVISETRMPGFWRLFRCPR